MTQTCLLDTSILIAHLRASKATATHIIVEIARKHIKGALSVLTYYELWNGATDDRHRKETKALISPFKIYGVSRDIADIASRFYRSIPKNERNKNTHLDILIAATAEYHRFKIITTNKKDFSRFKLTVPIEYLE